MNPLLMFSVLSASLMGSVHCAGMCGGMVGFATGSLNRKRRLGGHLGYHVGRLGAYLCLGAVAGAFGLGLDTAAARGGLGGGAALAAGLLMIVWALTKLVPSSWGLNRVCSWIPRRLSCGFSGSFSWIARLPALTRAAMLGLATGLLPCGWLYAFVLAAVGTGNVVTGAGILLAFWLGTLPALIGIGSVAQLLGQRARRLLPNLSALCLLVIGIGSVWSRYETAEQILPLTPSAWANETKDGADNAAAGANGANDTLPPCHRH